MPRSSLSALTPAVEFLRLPKVQIPVTGVRANPQRSSLRADLGSASGSCLFVGHPQGLCQKSIGAYPRIGGLKSPTKAGDRSDGAPNSRSVRWLGGSQSALPLLLLPALLDNSYPDAFQGILLMRIESGANVGEGMRNGHCERDIWALRKIGRKSTTHRGLGISRVSGQSGLGRIHLLRDTGATPAPELQTYEGAPSTSGSSERRRKLAGVRRRR